MNRNARFAEGESVDVAKYLEEHGNPEAAETWRDMHEKHKDNFKKAGRVNRWTGIGGDTFDVGSKVDFWWNGDKQWAGTVAGVDGRNIVVDGGSRSHMISPEDAKKHLRVKKAYLAPSLHHGDAVVVQRPIDAEAYRGSRKVRLTPGMQGIFVGYSKPSTPSAELRDQMGLGAYDSPQPIVLFGQRELLVNDSDFQFGYLVKAKKFAALSELEKFASRPLWQIAKEIQQDWHPVNVAARPYLEAMTSLDSIKDYYGADSGLSIVGYFLVNSSQWRGPKAKDIKMELKSMMNSGRHAAALSELEKLAADKTATTIGKGKNGYIAFYKGKKIEVMADTSLAAQTTAAAYFKARKSWEVDVVLAEQNGQQVSHRPMFASLSELEGLAAGVELEKLATEQKPKILPDLEDPGEVDRILADFNPGGTEFGKDDRHPEMGEGSMIPGLEDRLANYTPGKTELGEDDRHPENGEGSMIPGLEDRLAALEKLAMEVTAFDQESSDFCEWAANQPPMTKMQTVSMLKHSGVEEILPPKEPRPGPRFQEGDNVLISAHKHKDPETGEVYKEHDGKVGKVVGIHGMSVFVQFKSGHPAEFPDGQKPRGVGIYKWTPAYDMEGSKKLEIIYEAGGPVNADRVVTVQQYLGRGKSVERKVPYFTGHAFNARYNKSGGVYFSLFPQQRMHVDPQGQSTEAGFEATSMNPEVGRLHYMGLFGHRPSHWKAELELLREAAQAGAHAVMAADDTMLSRFEEGVPADPKKHLSPEDKEKWDKFHGKVDELDKTASDEGVSFKKYFSFQDRKGLRQQLQSNTDSHLRFGPYHAGQKVSYAGRSWYVLDADAEGSSFTLTLVSPDFSEIAREVPRDLGQGRTAGEDKTAHRDYIPKYVLQMLPVFTGFYMTDQGWNPQWYGKPTIPNLKKFVEAHNKSVLPGGPNDHIGIKGVIYGVILHDQLNHAQNVLRWEDKNLIRMYKEMGAGKVAYGKTDMTEEEKRDLIQKAHGMHITLDGKPAQIGGAKKDFATVHGEGEAEFAWETAKHILEDKGGHFKTASDDAGDEKESRFEEGKSADPTKNLSPEDAKKWHEMHDKHKDNFKTALEKTWNQKKACACGHGTDDDGDGDCPNCAGKKTAARTPAGLYGFTRKVQSDCETAARKVARTASSIAKRIYAKDGETAPFLSTHSKRGPSLPAQILTAAMKDLGPKIASTELSEEQQLRLAELRTKTAAGRKYGLYGFSTRAANLGLNACSQLRETAGHIASDLHQRRGDSHTHITGFLDKHASETNCLYSRLLHASYPEATTKLASQDWLTWEE